FLVSADRSRELRVWRTADGALTGTVPTPTVGSKVAWSPDSTLLALGGWDGAIHLWRAADGQKAGTFAAPSSAITDVVWSPDGTLLAATCDDWESPVLIWNVAESRVMRQLDAGSGVDALAWLPGRQTLALGTYEGVQLWHVPEGGIP